MEDETKKKLEDLKRIAQRQMDIPDKELGLLWQEYLGFVAELELGSTNRELHARLALLSFRSLNYASVVIPELRQRLELLEAFVGVQYPNPFPPSGSTVTFPGESLHHRLSSLESPTGPPRLE